MTIGWIGLGKIGSVLAGHLQTAGYDLIVHDLHQECGRQLLAGGARWGDTPGAVAAAADVIFTSLPGPPQVRKVMEGNHGVFDAIQEDATWIDMTTTDAAEMQRLGARAAGKGAAVLEAPVTGGLRLAKKGGITILVGGERSVFETHLPLLEIIGGQVVHLGPLGNASVVKVISNLLALGHMFLSGEAFMLGMRAGIELDALFEGIQASSGQSRTINNEMPLVYNGTYDVGFSMALACKDLALVHELGRTLGVPLELGGLIEQIYIRAKAQYGETANSTQVVKLLEDAVGAYLRSPAKPSPPDPDEQRSPT